MDNIESDMDSDTPMLSNNAKTFDSDSVPTDGNESSSDTESVIKKKKKKKLKKSRKKSMAKEDVLDKSKLTDDENDELLRDLETMLNEPIDEADFKDVGIEKVRFVHGIYAGILIHVCYTRCPKYATKLLLLLTRLTFSLTT